MVGIDEAGRGPLAGPLAVGAFAVKDMSVLKIFGRVKDSKQLTEKQRNSFFSKIKFHKNLKSVSYAVSFIGEASIDRLGLTRAVQVAVNRSLAKLTKNNFCDNNSKILLDGLLKAPAKFRNQKTIIGGDERERIIALASICAKVLRDKKMIRLAKKYPHYGFEIHKGYGTKSHYKSLKLLGLSPIHRRSFCKNIQ